MPDELKELLAAIKANDNETDSSLLIHRFACRYGYIAVPAILQHFDKWTRLIVWANELTRATGKGKSKMFWFWNKGSQDQLLKAWGFNLNGCHLCPFTPGQLGDGSIVYGKKPDVPITQRLADLTSAVGELQSNSRNGYTQKSLFPVED